MPTPAETRLERAHDAAARWLNENADDLLDVLSVVHAEDLPAGELSLADELREVMAEWKDASRELMASAGAVADIERVAVAPRSAPPVAVGTPSKPMTRDEVLAALDAIEAQLDGEHARHAPYIRLTAQRGARPTSPGWWWVAFGPMKLLGRVPVSVVVVEVEFIDGVLWASSGSVGPFAVGSVDDHVEWIEEITPPASRLAHLVDEHRRLHRLL